MNGEKELSIYVLPSEEDVPPRAILGEMTDEGMKGVLATWSRDQGTWTVEGVPVPTPLAEAITDHAKSLGVEW